MVGGEQRGGAWGEGGDGPELRKSRKERTMRRETGESERVMFPM
jgi:hypothetical protein